MTKSKDGRRNTARNTASISLMTTSIRVVCGSNSLQVTFLKNGQWNFLSQIIFSDTLA